MYQNIYCYRNKGSIDVHLWDDKRGYSNFIVKNYAYIKSNTGIYRSLYNDKLKKTTYWTREDENAGNVFESDVPLETKILIDRYSDSNEVSVGHRELFFDIEVDSSGGFPEWRKHFLYFHFDRFQSFKPPMGRGIRRLRGQRARHVIKVNR